MTPPPNTSRRYVAIAALGSFVLFALLFRHPLYSSYVYESFDSLLQNNVDQPASAWFAGGGYLRMDYETGMQSRYEIPVDMMDAEEYICDEVVPHDWISGDDSQRMCVNNIVFASAFFSNLAAQATLLNDTIEDKGNADRILRETHRQLEGVRGTRVLIVGDSQDRHWLEDIVKQYAHLLTIRALDYNTGEAFEGWYYHQYFAKSVTFPLLPSAEAVREYHAQPRPYVPKFDDTTTLHPDTWRIDYTFVHGMLESEEMDWNLAGVSPSSTARRMELSHDMWDGSSGDAGTPYSMIILNFGLWDLQRRNFHNFATTGRDAFVGLDHDWLSNYVEGGKEYIALSRRLWGRQPSIFLRTTADMDPNIDYSYRPPDMPKDTPRDRAFVPLKFQQLRTAQNTIISRERVASLPFGELLQGQPPKLALEDGMHPGPQANVMYMELLFRRLVPLHITRRE